MNSASIYVKETVEKGLGVFATSMIEEKALIEVCPVIIIDLATEINLIVCSSISHYAFRWSDDPNAIMVALGYGSIYNHSSRNNAFYKINYDNTTLEIMALRDIQPNEEITISYVPATTTSASLWFKDRGIDYID